MNEAQTRHDLIDPKLKEAGWEVAPAKIVCEHPVTKGRLLYNGKRETPLSADYVLYYERRAIAVVEAKKSSRKVEDGVAQARLYAEMLGVRFAYATNGTSIITIDMQTGVQNTYSELSFPAPKELLSVLEKGSDLYERCLEIPYEQIGGKSIRYYQERAVEKVLETFGKGKTRALLTLATGTGKTFIAYQLVNKLVKVKWSRKGIGVRKPRVLFLADRNILADQGKGAFLFEDDACFRLDTTTEKLPKDRIAYFTIYQTLLGERGDEQRYKAFKSDFFDLVIIDECHRGGANDESQWRVVLDYFSSACHLGLTATPRCDVNGDTYSYFGEPVYTYSLAQGIADGFLTPYRVCRMFTSEVSPYIRKVGDYVSEDEAIEYDKPYTDAQQARDKIVIPEKDRAWAEELLRRMPRNEKAVVFCEDQDHAQRMTLALRHAAAKRGIDDPHWCEQVTANTGTIGEHYLRLFQNTENEIPAVLTTSQKLSTGVDAVNIRHIVLFKEVKSMVEFKQIIGRGTRLCEGKGWFTIWDFTGATDKFNDPGWDGEVVCQKCGNRPCTCESPGGGKPPSEKQPCPDCGMIPCICLKPPKNPVIVHLGEGREITITCEESILFYDKLVRPKEFVDIFVAAVKSITGTKKTLAAKWRDQTERNEVLAALKEKGFDKEMLGKLQTMTNLEKSDILDVMMSIVYGLEPLKREYRAQKVEAYVKELPQEQREIARLVLKNYEQDGVWVLNQDKFTALLKQQTGNLNETIRKMKLDVNGATELFRNIQKQLYVV